jgi:Sigma-70, region 4
MVRGRKRNKMKRDAVRRMTGEGLTYTEIGKVLSISRERVRQIANSEGVLGIRSRAMTKARRQNFATLLRGGADVGRAAKARRISRQSANDVASDMRMSAREENARKWMRELAPLIERVKHGESFWSVAGRDPKLKMRLLRACQKLGVKSAHASRNRNYGSTPEVAEGRHGDGP